MEWKVSDADVDFLTSLNNKHERGSTAQRSHSSSKRSGGAIHTRRNRQRASVTDTIIQTSSNKATIALRKACSASDLDLVMKAIDDGAFVNEGDDRGRTPLHFATAACAVDIVKYLAGQGANPNVKDTNGNSPLHLAACTSNIAVITALLDAGCEIDSIDREGRTPIEFALSHLRILTRYRSNAEKYKSKVKDIVDLLQVYLSKSKSYAKHNLDFEELTSKLALGTSDSVDEVSDILQAFALSTTEG
eukprot:m.25507 g.25507  ORF g.25507 m.25507 type:complete len:247 (-) comp5772_c0_seq1:2009-2749(-)